MEMEIDKSLTSGLSEEETRRYIDLYQRARKARANAYGRYSGIQAGAALLVRDGTVITGCNVENASYGLTMCAERTAVFKAVSEGYQPGDFEAIAIVAGGDYFSPCGACREVLNEFGPEILVIFEYGQKLIITALPNLLPYGFRL